MQGIVYDRLSADELVTDIIAASSKLLCVIRVHGMPTPGLHSVYRTTVRQTYFIVIMLGLAFAVLPPKFELTHSSAGTCAVSAVLTMFRQSLNYSPSQTIHCFNEC